MNFFSTRDPDYNVQSKTVKLSYFTLFFFSYLTNFFSFISKLPNVARSHQKNKKTGRLLGTWYLAVFQKKLETKLFIFTVNFFFTLFFFYLVLALESISGVKSRLLCQTTLTTMFSQKLSNYHISLWRKKKFFIFNQFFLIHIKVAYCCEGSPKNNENPVAY
jgi:hypothetical protein